MPSDLVLTVPNVLTMIRILAVPCFAIAIWYQHMLTGFLIFVGAGLTDMLDGYIARTFNQGSSFGAVLDPAADKLLMTVSFLLLAFSPTVQVARIPAWVAILAISRDVLIALAALLSGSHFEVRNFRPTVLGKATTALQLTAIALALLFNVVPPRAWFEITAQVVYLLVAALVLASGMHYLLRGTVPAEG